MNEFEFPTNKVANVQSQLEVWTINIHSTLHTSEHAPPLQRLVEKNYYLNQSARDAYRSYILAYNSHQLKDIFNVHRLDLQAISKSFGFSGPPR